MYDTINKEEIKEFGEGKQSPDNTEEMYFEIPNDKEFEQKFNIRGLNHIEQEAYSEQIRIEAKFNCT